MIEGSFLLISSNRGYEIDAFLEAFAVAVEHNVALDLFGLVDDGRVVAVLADPRRAMVYRLLSDLNDHSGKLRFVKRTVPCSMVGRLRELGDACDLLNSVIREHKNRKHVAVKLEGVNFRDPKRMEIISRVMAGEVAADLRSPEIVVYLYVGEGFFLAGVMRPLSVLGVENRSPLG